MLLWCFLLLWAVFSYINCLPSLCLRFRALLCSYQQED